MIKRLLARRGRWISGQWLSSKQISLLKSLAQGGLLRSHRDLEGNKRYELTTLTDEKETVDLDIVQNLRRKRLIETNHKFPSATFILTGHGSKVARQLHHATFGSPLTARNFTEKD